MISSFLSLTNLSEFQLSAENVFEFDSRTIVIKKWNWDYKLAHNFQRHSLKVLDEIPQLRILICCNHPQVLTNGRGLQKPRKGEKLELVEFNPANYPHLPYPLHQIERGGGLTFHHPGQFIFYPIVKLNPKTLSLSKMIDDIFETSSQVLQSWGITDLDYGRKLLGLWHKDQKIASMGIAIEKLTTFHGMALNVFRDDGMMKAMNILNPCGLSSETYTSVEELTDMKEKDINQFSDEFLRRLSHVWQ